MVDTGYISFITETGGGQDASGNPLAPTKTPSVYFRCNLLVQKKEYKILVDGQWQDAKYSIYLDANKVVDLDLSAVTEVILQDARQVSLGYFQIMNKEHLDLMRKLKIVV